MSDVKARKNACRLGAALSYRARLLCHTILVGGIALVATPLFASSARAATGQMGDFTITLQSTLGCTLGVTATPINNTYLDTFNPATESVNGLNSDDGDRNFRTGLLVNRFQTLEQLNIQDGNYGLRASALAYIDTVYLHNSDNNSPSTFNSYGIGPQDFPSATIANEGRRIEPLALFVYGSSYLNNGSKANLTLGANYQRYAGPA